MATVPYKSGAKINEYHRQMSKILDNKYKIGQKVWLVRDGLEEEVCPHCGNIDYRHDEYYIESVEIEEIKAPTGEISYWVNTFEMIKEADIFPTKRSAQSRCDELNGVGTSKDELNGKEKK